jgi:hypothetical protein
MVKMMMLEKNSYNKGFYLEHYPKEQVEYKAFCVQHLG